MTRTHASQDRPRRRLRRVRRGLLVVLAVVALGLLSLLLAPVRGGLFALALSRVDAALPGDWSHSRAAWPKPGRLELNDLLWVQRGDTLLAAGSVRLDVSLRDLLRRDVLIRDLEIAGLRADVAAIQAALPPAGGEPTTTADDGRAFPRAGSVPKLPSVAVARARIAAAWLELGEGRSVKDALVRGAAELRVEHRAFLTVDTLRVARAPAGWSVTESSLNLQDGDTSARLRASGPDGRNLALDITPAPEDSFTIAVTATGRQPATLHGRGVLGASPLRVGLRLAGDVDGTPVKRLGLSVVAPEQADGPIVARVRAATFGLDLAAAAEIVRGDTLIAVVTPVTVLRDTTASLLDHRPGDFSGRVAVHGGRLELNRLRVEGDLGEWQVDGVRAAERLDLDVVGDWDEPPAALLQALGLEPSAWPRGTRSGLDLHAHVFAGTAGGALDTGRLDAEFTLPGPAFLATRFPELRLGDWTVLAGDVTAELAPDPDGTLWTAALDLARTPWLSAGRLRAHGRGAAATVDSLRLTLPGGSATAAGRVSDEALDLRGTIVVPHAGLLSRLTLPPPDMDLAATLAFALTGTRTAPRLAATLDGRIRTAEFDVPNVHTVISASRDSVAVDLHLPAGGSVGALQLRDADLRLAGRPASQRLPFTLTVADTADGEFHGAGLLRLDPPGLDLTLAGRAGGTPIEHLGLTATAVAGADGPVRAELRLAAAGLDLLTAATITRGDSLVVDLAPVAVVVDTLAAVAPRRPAAPSGRIVLRDGVLDLRGLTVTGALGGWRLDGRRSLAAVDLSLTADWPEPPAALALWSQAPMTVWQPSSLAATLQMVPSAAGGAPDSGRLTGSVTLPGPASFADRAPGWRLDDLVTVLADFEAAWRPTATEPDWSAAVDLGRTPWLIGGRIVAHGTGATTVLDSLALAMPGLTTAASGLAAADSLDLAGRVDLPDAELLARLDGLPPWTELQAGVAWQAAGPPRTPRVDATITGRVATPQLTLPQLVGTFHGDMDTVSVALRLPRGGTLGNLAFTEVAATLAAAGFTSLAEGADLTLSAAGDQIGLEGRGHVRSKPQSLLAIDALRLESMGRDLVLKEPWTAALDGRSWRVSPLELSGGLGTVRGGGLAAPDSLDLALETDLRLPLLLLRTLAPAVALPSDQELDLEVTAALNLAGTPVAPRCEGNLTAAVRKETGPADLSLRADLAAVSGRVTATLQLEHEGRSLAVGDALVPAVLTLDPPAFVPSAEDSFHVSLHTETLDLTDLADYLPPALKVTGPITAAGDLRGVGREAVLGGFVDAPRLRLTMQDGSWLVLGGRMNLGGSARKPALKGRLGIEGGVIVIPEVPAPLLPTTGSALLLDRPVGVVVTDSLVTTPVEAPFAADLDLRLFCPGDLWLRGRGLSLQLNGDLRVTQKDRTPAVVGELRAVQGTYRFLGTLFTVERGVVTFYGDMDADPRLDLELTSEGDGNVYRIAMEGWALAPELRLTSEPEMTEGDIVSSLLFGKPLDQLDSGQESLLKARTAQVLTSLGVTRVTDRLSRTLGADLVAFNQSSDSGASSLMLGKYLSPRLLLKYEQFLDRSTSYYVRLNYALSRFFRLETSVGQGEESGVELKWARDY